MFFETTIKSLPVCIFQDCRNIALNVVGPRLSIDLIIHPVLIAVSLQKTTGHPIIRCYKIAKIK